jgi:hypothetical protein
MSRMTEPDHHTVDTFEDVLKGGYKVVVLKDPVLAYIDLRHAHEESAKKSIFETATTVVETPEEAIQLTLSNPRGGILS